MNSYSDDPPPTGAGINMDVLAAWMERHPEISEIIVTEVTTTRSIYALPTGETFTHVA